MDRWTKSREIEYKNRIATWLQFSTELITNCIAWKTKQILNIKMVFLKTPKRYLTIFGILPISGEHLPDLLNLRKNQSLFNSMHIVFIIVCLALYISSVLYFLFCKAKTFAEYSEAALFLVVTVTRIAFYFMLLSQKKELAALFTDLEDTIEKSESFNLIFLKTSTNFRNYKL